MSSGTDSGEIEDSENVDAESPRELYGKSITAGRQAVNQSYEEVRNWAENQRLVVRILLIWIPLQIFVNTVLVPAFRIAASSFGGLAESSAAFLSNGFNTLPLQNKLLIVLISAFVIHSTTVNIKMRSMDQLMSDVYTRLSIIRNSIDNTNDENVAPDGGLPQANGTGEDGAIDTNISPSGIGAAGGSIAGGLLGGLIGLSGLFGGVLLGAVIGREYERTILERRLGGREHRRWPF